MLGWIPRCDYLAAGIKKTPNGRSSQQVTRTCSPTANRQRQTGRCEIGILMLGRLSMAASCQRQNLSPATASSLPAATQRTGWSFLPFDHPIILAWLRRWPPPEGIGKTTKRDDFLCQLVNMPLDGTGSLSILRRTLRWYGPPASYRVVDWLECQSDTIFRHHSWPRLLGKNYAKAATLAVR